jgi:hypothetical protein
MVYSGWWILHSIWCILHIAWCIVRGTMSVLPSRKLDHEISKSDVYQNIFLPIIRPKGYPISLFWRSKSDLFQKLYSNIEQSNFFLKNIHIL